MLKRLTFATIVAVLVGAFGVASATADPPDRPATPPPTDFWQNKHFMNMAHQGGEVEAPASTLYAFDTAIRDRGADTLEMDGYVTQDGHFVITHDFNPRCLSNIEETEHAGKTINQLTLAELKTLDFAYWFLPGPGHYGGCNVPQRNGHEDAQPEDYIYRGIALGEKPAPEGYTADDFKIPTLREVLDAFPDTPMNIDMKNNSGAPGIEMTAAEVVADVMNDYPERSEDVIIASFTGEPIAKFHELAPNHKALSAGENQLLAYITGEPIEPVPVAVQPPDIYGGTLPTVPVLKPLAEYDGFAIHVWPAGSEGPEVWQSMLDQGADGFFTQQPGALHEFLCEQGVPRPDGSLRCPEQQCPEGFTGWAPNCEPVPVCPEGTEGTPPDCEPIVRPTVVRKVAIAPKRGAVRTPRTFKVIVGVAARMGDRPQRVRLNLRSSSRHVHLPKSVVLTLRGPAGRTAIATRVIRVRATRRARGRVAFVTRHGKLRDRTVLRMLRPLGNQRRARR